MNKALQNWILTSLGLIFVIIGVVGIFLPLLPTTPFLLLAAFCFSKGSPQFHQWLLQHKRLGPPIRDWETRGVIRLPVKWVATSMLLVSAIFIYLKPTIPLAGKISFSVVALGALSFIWTRPSQ
jgi:uncharacterized membrane protein YbaN (DUF454 family)